MKIKIITLNCFDSPLSFNRKARQEALIPKIIALKPDIVFLQEIAFSETAIRIAKMFQEKGYNVYYDADFVFNRGGLFTASLFPLSNFEFIRFSNQGKFLSLQATDRILGKGYQQMKLSLNEKDILLFNVHLASVYKDNSAREQKILQDQFEMLSQRLEKGKYLIVSGDFNFSPKNSFYSKLLKTRELTDPLLDSKLVTVSSKNTNRQGLYKNDSNVKLDYTFISKRLFNKVKSKVIFDKLFEVDGQKVHLSDHFGLLTTLEV
jgi:endonuclease/exonuclease/phosphatase family metal-dependent hydrolase